MSNEIHKKIKDKLERLSESEKKLAKRALELSARTNSRTVADKLYREINKITS